MNQLIGFGPYCHFIRSELLHSDHVLQFHIFLIQFLLFIFVAFELDEQEAPVVDQHLLRVANALCGVGTYLIFQSGELLAEGSLVLLF